MPHCLFWGHYIRPIAGPRLPIVRRRRSSHMAFIYLAVRLGLLTLFTFTVKLMIECNFARDFRKTQRSTSRLE